MGPAEIGPNGHKKLPRILIKTDSLLENLASIETILVVSTLCYGYYKVKIQVFGCNHLFHIEKKMYCTRSLPTAIYSL